MTKFSGDDHMRVIVTKMCVEDEFFKIVNVPPWTLMSWNGLALAHYVGCVTWLTLTGLPGT
jgi:hypothetical protein